MNNCRWTSLNDFVKKILINIALTCVVILLMPPAAALKNDFQQSIQINSVKQFLDLEKNITTFTEKVVIKQGSINIQADKVVITHPNSDIKKMVIKAYGTPANFYQLQDNGKPIKGRSDKICYEMDKELVTLTGNAYLEQLDSNVKSDKIIYSIPTKKMEAFSDKEKRVIITLLPSQLQEKNLNVKNKQ